MEKVPPSAKVWFAFVYVIIAFCSYRCCCFMWEAIIHYVQCVLLKHDKNNERFL